MLAEVKQFEARTTQLQQRVQLIEQLRAGQSVPVQLLDHVSRSLPDMLWLTDLQQEGAAVTIEGRSTTLIALSDFVGNLGSNAGAAEADRDRQQPGRAGRRRQGPARPPVPSSISLHGSRVANGLAGVAPSEPAPSGKKGRSLDMALKLQPQHACPGTRSSACSRRWPPSASARSGTSTPTPAQAEHRRASGPS